MGSSTTSVSSLDSPCGFFLRFNAENLVAEEEQAAVVAFSFSNPEEEALVASSLRMASSFSNAEDFVAEDESLEASSFSSADDFHAEEEVIEPSSLSNAEDLGAEEESLLASSISSADDFDAEEAILEASSLSNTEDLGAEEEEVALPKEIEDSCTSNDCVAGSRCVPTGDGFSEYECYCDNGNLVDPDTSCKPCDPNP